MGYNGAKVVARPWAFGSGVFSSSVTGRIDRDRSIRT
jgi:hypothetical protein